MPNPKLETYKNKATGTVYDYTDAAAQAALAGILNGTDIDSFADVETALAGKVDKVAGKGLSTNDYDNTAKGIVTTAQDNIKANTKLIKDTVGWSGKNKGQWINKSLDGDATTGYKLDNGGSSLIARVEQNTSYIVSRKHGQGNRFRIIGFVNEPSSVADLSSEQLYNNNSADTYTVNSGSYNYLVFTYDSSTSISQDTAEAMLRDANILDDTYEPYFGSTAFPRSEQAVLGAKNLVNVSTTVPISTASVVFLNNGFTVSGTSMTYASSNTSLNGLKVGEKYIASVDVMASDNSDARIAIRNSGGIVQYSKIIGNNTGHYEFEFVYQEGYYFSVMANYSTAATASITVDNVMIRFASDSDSTYAPYSLTNKELTDYNYDTRNRLGWGSAYTDGTEVTIVNNFPPVKTGKVYLTVIKHYTSATTFDCRLGILMSYTENNVIKFAHQMLVDKTGYPNITSVEQTSNGLIKFTFDARVYCTISILSMNS